MLFGGPVLDANSSFTLDDVFDLAFHGFSKVWHTLAGGEAIMRKD